MVPLGDTMRSISGDRFCCRPLSVSKRSGFTINTSN